MYDKIYKEIFLKDFILKRKLHEYTEDGRKNTSLWEVKIYNKSYFLLVYKDDILDYLEPEEVGMKEYEVKNEAELAHFRFGKCETEKRIIANRLFLELVKRYSKEAPYLYRIEKINKETKQLMLNLF